METVSQTKPMLERKSLFLRLLSTNSPRKTWQAFSLVLILKLKLHSKLILIKFIKLKMPSKKNQRNQLSLITQNQLRQAKLSKNKLLMMRMVLQMHH